MKKIILLLGCFYISLLHAKDYSLAKAKAEYTVKHLFKTVKGESNDLKGKMVCEKQSCEFLVAIASKSFVSSDSNRDLNLQMLIEVTKYPFITVKGTVAENDLLKNDFVIKSLVNFHGVEKEYNLKINKKESYSGSFSIQLDNHQIERPSLLMAKIENDVPINFSFEWKE